MITWDEAKRLGNIKNHGLDFAGCEGVFDGPVITRDDDRLHYGEQRINLLGVLTGKIVHMTYAERGDALHIISLRMATKHETRYYLSQVQF